MTDIIRDDEPKGAAELTNASELTTKDLAEAGERQQRRIPSEPILRAHQEPTSQMPVDRRPQDQDLVDEPRAGTGVAAATVRAREEDLGPLFPADEANNLRSRWDSVQVKFVDEPRQAVEDADRMIATTMKRLAEIFAEERQKLEHQWDRGDNVSTEDLRLALRRYRSFFSRLLNV